MRPGERSHRERFESFLEVWLALADDLESGESVVVVEGERDRLALERLGLRVPLAVLHDGQSISAFAEGVARGHRRVIVLTDWDRKGGVLARRLSEQLAEGPAVPDLEWRRRLGQALAGEIVHVEGLYRWARRTAERLREDLSGRLS